MKIFGLGTKLFAYINSTKSALDERKSAANAVLNAIDELYIEPRLIPKHLMKEKFLAHLTVGKVDFAMANHGLAFEHFTMCRDILLWQGHKSDDAIMMFIQGWIAKADARILLNKSIKKLERDSFDFNLKKKKKHASSNYTMESGLHLT